MMKQREGNYDILRFAAAAAVVIAHCTAAFIETVIWDFKDGLPLNHPLYSCVYEGLMRFSVPAFLMLTGAFLLHDERTKDWKQFYARSWKKIGIPAAAAIAFAVVYNLVTVGFLDGQGIGAALMPLLSGAPFYHLWYLPVMGVCYAAAPWLARMKAEIGEKAFIRVSLAMLLLGCLGLWLNEPVINHWFIGEGVCYLGYMMMGDVLRFHHGENRGGLLIALLSLVPAALAGVLLYRSLMAGADRTLAEHQLIMSYSPLIVLSSILVFAGFSRMHVRAPHPRLYAHTYEIYLLHAFVLDVIIRISRHFFGQRWLTHLDARIAPFGLAALVYILCYMIGGLLRKRGRRASVTM